MGRAQVFKSIRKVHEKLDILKVCGSLSFLARCVPRYHSRLPREVRVLGRVCKGK
jgi:hypothetical protein